MRLITAELFRNTLASTHTHEHHFGSRIVAKLAGGSGRPGGQRTCSSVTTRGAKRGPVSARGASGGGTSELDPRPGGRGRRPPHESRTVYTRRRFREKPISPGQALANPP